jgi:two-component system sensor histidine kinase KdpD
VGGRAGLVVEGDLDPVLAPEAVATWPAPAASGPPVAAPGATSLPEIEGAGLPAPLRDAGVRLAQPIAREGALLGLLLLGEKRSERRFVEEDLRLASGVAGIAGPALERLDLVQSVAEEALARRALATLHREKTEFLLRVAHDLRTPLAAVRWSAQNLRDGIPSPVTPEQAETLGSIDAAAGRLQRLVDNLLDVSRLEVGAPPAPPEDVDLRALVPEVAEGLRLVADAKGVRLAVDVAADLPRVRGARGRLSQVVANLVDNAVKYSPPGGTVDVAARGDGNGGLLLTVRARGPGLDESLRDRLFELFRQGAPSPHGGARGFGIGLHVVKSWTEAMGGSVAAANHAEGGALFTCRFPAAPRDLAREGT